MTSQPAHNALVASMLIAIVELSFSLAYAQDLQTQQAALLMITKTANEICQSAPLEATSQGVNLSGTAAAKLGGLIGQVADLGITGAGEYQTNRSMGVLQKDLITAIQGGNDCKLEVFRTLEKKLLSGAPPPPVPRPRQSTFWNHNGSIMYLVANGNSREFYYQQPRPGMVQAGAQPGSLLFQGEYRNGQYAGTAYIFNRSCGKFPYQVSGPVLDEDRRVVMYGNAPRVSQDCQIVGEVRDTLEFTLIP